jgi:hydrogenase maturation factor HypF (carbamoyltransferase family)
MKDLSCADEVTVTYDLGICGNCCKDVTTELVRVQAGLVEWEFTTCMECGRTARQVTEFDKMGGLR